jgi:hypothetical protein
VLSCIGRVFLKDMWIGFVEGSSRELKDPLQLEENIELSCVDLDRESGVCVSCGIRA